MSDISNDIEDIFLELKDDGYSVDMPNIQTETFHFINITISKQNKKFIITDVYDYIDRLSEYLNNDFKLYVEIAGVDWDYRLNKSLNKEIGSKYWSSMKDKFMNGYKYDGMELNKETLILKTVINIKKSELIK